MEHPFSTLYLKFEELKVQNEELFSLLRKTTELLHSEVSHYNWVGFYLLDAQKNELVLGPFTGASTDHTHIPVGKGICGQVAESKRTMIVQDVTLQDNYLACSLDVQSEIVVPIIKNGHFVAEIDIDSHAFAPFTKHDELFLNKIAHQLSELF
jgi:L-methionine (R)-S-oxide reductase